MFENLSFRIPALNVDRNWCVSGFRMLVKYFASISYRMAEETKAVIMEETVEDIVNNGTYLIQAIHFYFVFHSKPVFPKLFRVADHK